VKRRSRAPQAGPSHPFSSPTDSTFPHPGPSNYHSHSTGPSQWPRPARIPPITSLLSPVDSGTPRDTQISSTDPAVPPLHHPYLPRPSSDHSSDYPSPSKRSRAEHLSPPRSNLLATDAQPKSSRLSRGPPPLVVRPELPRHRTWPPTDNSRSLSVGSSSHPSSSTFPSSLVHPPAPFPSIYAPSYHRPRPGSRGSPPLPRAPDYSPVSHPRSTPPIDRAQWPTRLSIPEMSEGSSRSQTTSHSPPNRRQQVLPRAAFYEAYAMKPRPDHSGDVSRTARATSPPPPEARLGGGPSRHSEWDRPSPPRPSNPRRYEDNAPGDFKPSARLSAPKSSASADSSPKSSPGRR
jgi:hypothetical protein